MSNNSYLKINSDSIVAFTVLKRLLTSITQSDAFKLELVDSSGKILKMPETEEEKSSLTILDQLVFKLRRMLGTKLVSLNKLLYLVQMSDNFQNKLSLKDSKTGKNEFERIRRDLNNLGESFEYNQIKKSKSFSEMYVCLNESTDEQRELGKRVGLIHVGRGIYKNKMGHKYTYDQRGNIFRDLLAVTKIDPTNPEHFVKVKTIPIVTSHYGENKKDTDKFISGSFEFNNEKFYLTEKEDNQKKDSPGYFTNSKVTKSPKFDIYHTSGIWVGEGTTKKDAEEYFKNTFKNHKEEEFKEFIKELETKAKV